MKISPLVVIYILLFITSMIVDIFVCIHNLCNCQLLRRRRKLPYNGLGRMLTERYTSLLLVWSGIQELTGTQALWIPTASYCCFKIIVAVRGIRSSCWLPHTIRSGSPDVLGSVQMEKDLCCSKGLALKEIPFSQSFVQKEKAYLVLVFVFIWLLYACCFWFMSLSGTCTKIYRNQTVHPSTLTAYRQALLFSFSLSYDCLN